jgi:pyruvate dehydrogenase E2 component (dihydrolipoamide acetyltransferase)
MGEFVMPSLGADMEAGILVEWLKKPGDRVQRGDIVAVVETDKGAIEIEIFENGVIEKLLIDVGKKVPVGTPLAMIGAVGAAKPRLAPAAAPPVAPAAPAAVAPKPAATVERGAAEAARPRASPAARRLAQEKGLCLAGLAGSGPGGAVVSADLLRQAPAPEPRKRGIDPEAMRRAIGAAMARSKREIPHYYLSHRIDLSAPLAWLQAENARRPPERRLLLQALLLKAVAAAAQRRPEFNGFYGPEGFTAGQAIHIGAAIAIKGGGLVAPAIHDVGNLDLDAVMQKLKDLIARTRAGTLRSSELSDPTITVSALGERGVEALQGVIYPPQVALVGFGTPLQRPWAIDGRIEARPVMAVSLAADHRVTDGHLGALFLLEIEKQLSQPEQL